MWSRISLRLLKAEWVRVSSKGCGWVLTASLLFFIGGVRAAAAPVLAEDRIARAEALGLDRDPYWLLLGHYHRSWRGWESAIDDPRFFLAPDGKRNPRAELHATLKALFALPPTNPADHAVCRFPARYEWLRERLGVKPADAAAWQCPGFEEVYHFLQPRSVALVFPAAYVNSPASMFGHTLLVIDSEGKNRLLSRSISYAAMAGTDVGPMFILGSFVGVFKGYYFFQPYYDRVKSYNAIDFRDMWEYALDLDDSEIRRLMLHAWELQGIYTRYFFLDENCAFNLFYLLDAARPALNLTGRFNLWVIPTDTIRAVLAKDMVTDVQYRPSKVSSMRCLGEHLAPDERQLALRMGRGLAPPATVFSALHDRDRQAMVLDLASDYIQYAYAARLISAETYKATLLDTLRQRSRLGGVTQASQPVAPARPDAGHDSNRLALGGGLQQGEGFLALRFRPAYQSLSDDDTGMEPGAQIQFANVEVRYYSGDEELLLQRFDFIDILSLTARDDIFKPSSWRATFGFLQHPFHEGDHGLVFAAGTGVGYTYAIGKKGLWYAMVDADVWMGRKLADDYALGLGPSAGCMYRPVPGWKILLQAKAEYLGAGDDLIHLRGNVDNNFRLGKNQSLVLEYSYEDNDGYGEHEGRVFWNWYF